MRSAYYRCNSTFDTADQMAAKESGAQDSQQPGLTGWPEKLSVASHFKRFKVIRSQPERKHNE